MVLETSTATTHGEDKYLADKQRSGVGLCLSGGGFRASLFHLGTLRRLNELGVLGKVTHISSVSGGSVLSAFLASRMKFWPKPGEVYANWEEEIAAPFRQFVGHNFRVRPLLLQLLPWNWRKPAFALAQGYRQHVTKLNLAELPEHPKFTFCSTDMTFGVNFTFEREKVGDYEIGFARPPKGFALADAVAASSCFPPVFNPLPVEISPESFIGGDYFEKDESDATGSVEKRKRTVTNLRLTDGGVYDNLGLEPVWKICETVLVSDGGQPFDAENASGFFSRLGRYVNISNNQALAVRKRWLVSNFISGQLKGAYWGIGSVPSHYGSGVVQGYSEALVDEVVSEVRTDLDAFSLAEIAVLENHGYTLAEAAVRQHVSHLVEGQAGVALPHAEWVDEEKIRSALAGSYKRSVFGRFNAA